MKDVQKDLEDVQEKIGNLAYKASVIQTKTNGVGNPPSVSTNVDEEKEALEKDIDSQIEALKKIKEKMKK